MNKNETSSPMEFGSTPLDPIYAWSIVLEPVETMIEHISGFIDIWVVAQIQRMSMLGEWLEIGPKEVQIGTLTTVQIHGPQAVAITIGRSMIGKRLLLVLMPGTHGMLLSWSKIGKMGLIPTMVYL